jgi:hypothetical protein
MRLPYLIHLVFFSISILFSNLFGQSLANYSSVRNSGVSYTTIMGSGTAVSSWRNNGTGVTNDNRSEFVNIGFDFWYDGVRYTQFSVSTNGYIDFSTSTLDGTGGNAFGASNVAFTGNNINQLTATAIAPFYDDLATQGGTLALGSSIQYKISGTAPNRSLTVEWSNMCVNGNTTPNLSFQVVLAETTGIITMNYGTMNAGTNGFSYSMGLNSVPMDPIPSAAQLKTLQTPNTNNFTFTPTNNLSIIPASGSQYIFTPPVPAAATGLLTFSGIMQSSMTLNWPNWATNEVGYVIYNSTDNINFSFAAQTTANAVSAAVSGLLPSTTYFWKVFAVTEGCISSSITGSATTLPAGNKISVITGNWSNPNTWLPVGVPSLYDNVTIANGHQVTIDMNALCNNLTVGQGTSGILRIGNTTVPRVTRVNGLLTISSGGSFLVNAGPTAVHSLTLTNNVINNGTLNLAPDANSLCNVFFLSNGSLNVSGSGSVTNFNTIYLSLGTSSSNVLDIQTPNFTAPRDFLSLVNGTFKLSTTGASSITPYSIATTIPSTGGIWLNSAASTINFSGSVTLKGNLTVSNGILNVGDIANEDLIANGGTLSVSNGTINIAGKYYPFSTSSPSNFMMSGGNVIVPAFGSTNITTAPFQISSAGSQFIMSGGSIIIPREGGSGAQDLGFFNTVSGSTSITGGTLQIGTVTSPAAQIIKINSVGSIGNLLVSSANVTASVTTNSLSVNGHVTITSGTLSATSQTISLGGNWNNNTGMFLPGTGLVSFTGTSSQSIYKASGEVFNNVSFSNAGNKQLFSSITVNTLTIQSGSFSANTFSVFLSGSWINNGGTFVPGTSTVTFTNSIVQAIFKSGGETFNNLIFSGAGNKSLLSSINANDLTISAGSLTTNAFNVSLTGNWTNNGGLYIPGQNTTIFTGLSAQTILKAGGEIFNNISFSNSGAKMLASAITASNVVIQSGSTVDVSTANYQMNVKGDFLNNGTFNAQRGLVLLNGTVLQNIGGSSTTNFYNLSLVNSNGASLTNAQNLINTLTLTSGVFNTNGKVFTMVSTATNTARIGPINSGADIIGNVTVQRYAPGGYTGWALLGTPIASALTFQDWDDDMPISCNSCPDGSAAGFLSIYSYDETATGSYSASAAYVPISSITNPITPNKGYWVYLGTGQTSTAPITIDVTGTVRKFTNVIPLSKTNTGVAGDDGWNLIHNPYPSAIKWSSLRNNNPNVDNAIYGYNADLNGGAGGTVAYVNGISSPAIGAGGISDTIPMCQGFQVHCTAATSLTALENHKVSGNPTFLKSNQGSSVAASQQLLRIHLKGPMNFNDETVLYTQSGASNQFDSEFDAIKMVGQDPNAPLIMLKSGLDEFQVNGVGPISSTFSMPLKITSGYNGTYTISAANCGSFPSGACISLHDALTSSVTDLRTTNYVFSLSSSTITSRFTLHITINPLEITSQMTQPDCVHPQAGFISAKGNNAGPWNYLWKDENGITVKTSLNKYGADTLTNLAGGNYSLDISTVGQCDHKDSVFTIDEMIVPTAQFYSADTVYISNNGAIQFTNQSVNATQNSWNFGDGFGMSLAVNPAYNYLTAGHYTVTLVTGSNSGCLDTTSKSIVVLGGMLVTGIPGIQGETLVLKNLGENEFVLDGSLGGNYEVSFKLYDGFGKLVTDYGNLFSNVIKLPLKLNNLNSGVYFLNATGANSNKTIKLQVAK